MQAHPIDPRNVFQLGYPPSIPRPRLFLMLCNDLGMCLQPSSLFSTPGTAKHLRTSKCICTPASKIPLAPPLDPLFLSAPCRSQWFARLITSPRSQQQQQPPFSFFVGTKRHSCLSYMNFYLIAVGLGCPRPQRTFVPVFSFTGWDEVLFALRRGNCP